MKLELDVRYCGVILAALLTASCFSGSGDTNGNNVPEVVPGDSSCRFNNDSDITMKVGSSTRVLLEYISPRSHYNGIQRLYADGAGKGMKPPENPGKVIFSDHCNLDNGKPQACEITVTAVGVGEILIDCGVLPGKPLYITVVESGENNMDLEP